VILGNTASFSVTASGNPAPAFLWQSSTDLGANWAEIPSHLNLSSNSATFTFAPQPSDGGTQYRAIARNSEGPQTSSPANLTVEPAALAITAPDYVTTGAPCGVGIAVTDTFHIDLDWTATDASLQDAGTLSQAKGVPIGEILTWTAPVSPADCALAATSTTNPDVTATKAITVVPPPSVLTFSAEPPSLDPNGGGPATSTLTWSINGASSITISPSIGEVTLLPAGSKLTPTLTAPTTYTLTAMNAAGDAAGTVTRTVTVTMPGPEITGFTKTSTTIPALCSYCPCPNADGSCGACTNGKLIPVPGSTHFVQVSGTWTSGTLTAPGGGTWTWTSDGKLTAPGGSALAWTNGGSAQIQIGATTITGTCPSISDEYCSKALGTWTLSVTRNGQHVTQTLAVPTSLNAGGSCAW